MGPLTGASRSRTYRNSYFLLSKFRATAEFFDHRLAASANGNKPTGRLTP